MGYAYFELWTHYSGRRLWLVRSMEWNEVEGKRGEGCIKEDHISFQNSSTISIHHTNISSETHCKSLASWRSKAEEL